MKYLHNFSYGQMSMLEDGTVLLGHTIIAHDRQMRECPPGLYHNVWALNRTIPGPIIGATESDLVGIHSTNKGSKSHSQCCKFEAINIRVNCIKMMKMLSIDEQTYRRVGALNK